MALNFGPPVMNFEALGSLGKTFFDAQAAAQKRGIDQQKQQLLAGLGQGNGDYQKVGLGLIGAGDVQSGVALLGLAQKDKERQLEQDWIKQNSGAPSAPSAPAVPLGSDPRASLIQNESGGRWNAQNDAVGAGGKVGHFGRLQFGQARLEEAAAAGAIPAGTSPQQFMQSPELQQAAERWHFGDIDQNIKANGYDRLVGQPINGVPVTIDGLRAVAHLGGVQGMKRFVETGGRYNPADANGTRLSDYFARHGGGSGQPAQAPVQVAENEADVQRLEARMPGYGGGPVQVAQAPAQAGAPVADVPAAGASPAQGFAVPGAAPQQAQSIAADPKVQEARRRYMTAPSERTRAAAKADLDLAIEDAKRRTEGDKPTEQSRNYEAYRREEAAAGREPLSRLDFLKAQRTQITNNVAAGEKEEEKEIGKASGKRAGDTMAAAASASKQLMRLGQIDALMKNVETGRLSPGRMTIAALGKSLGVDDGYLEAIGLDPKRVGDAQALNAISGRMLVDMIGSGGFPANNFSNTDREFLTGTLPSLANDPRANKLLITAAKRMAELDIEKAKTWRTWKRDNPKGSFDDFELEFADKVGGTDRFADLVQEAQKLTGGGAPAAQPGQPTARPQQPASGTPRTATNPNTGERIMLTPDGQWVPYS